MRKIFFSFLALFMSLSVFAAVGDKIYFVNSLDWETLYVTEYNSAWVKLVDAQAAVSEGWKYSNHDVYSYTIQNEDVTICLNYGETWTDPAITPIAGRYYTVQTGEGTWLKENFYNEFYFMDNNDKVQGVTPHIMLYNNGSESWENLTTWPGVEMAEVGNLKSVKTYKAVVLTDKEATNVQFVNSVDSENDKTDSYSIEAGKKFYGWNGLKTMNEVAPLHLVGDQNISGHNWDATALQMWWDETNKIFTYTVKNIFVPAEGDYSYRTILGDSGDDVWNFKFPHSNNLDWNESLHISAAGMYGITYTYNPLTDELTADASKYFSRDVTNGNYGTICLPNASTSWENATFYTIAGSIEGGIELEEVTNNYLVAGRPYIFKATNTWITVWFNDEASAASPVEAGTNGLKGSYTEQTLDNTSENLYVLSNNEFRAVGENVKVGAFRAYLDMAAVTQAPAHAPGKRYVRVGVQAKMPTSFEEVQANDQTSKRIENGHLYILKNGVRYNAQGQIVK